MTALRLAVSRSVFVITSYSIHYTKLYEIVSVLKNIEKGGRLVINAIRKEEEERVTLAETSMQELPELGIDLSGFEKGEDLIGSGS